MNRLQMFVIQLKTKSSKSLKRKPKQASNSRVFLLSNMRSFGSEHAATFVKDKRGRETNSYIVIFRGSRSRSIGTEYTDSPFNRRKNLDPFTSNPQVLQHMKEQIIKVSDNKQRQLSSILQFDNHVIFHGNRRKLSLVNNQISQFIGKCISRFLSKAFSIV